MKKLLFLLGAVLCLFVGRAQTASDSVTIELSAWEHAFITAFTPDKAQMDAVQYFKGVAKQLVLDSAGWIKDKAQTIRSRVHFDRVKQLYLAIGSGQERLTGYYNTIIKQKLFPQLTTEQQAALMALKNQSGDDTEELIKWGMQYLINFKL